MEIFLKPAKTTSTKLKSDPEDVTNACKNTLRLNMGKDLITQVGFNTSNLLKNYNENS